MKLDDLVIKVPKDKSVDEILTDFMNRKEEVIFIHSSVADKIDKESTMDSPQIFLTPALWKDWYLLKHIFADGKITFFSDGPKEVNFFSME